MTGNEIRQMRDKQGVIRDQQIHYYQMWALMEIAALLTELRDTLPAAGAPQASASGKNRK